MDEDTYVKVLWSGMGYVRERMLAAAANATRAEARSRCMTYHNGSGYVYKFLPAGISIRDSMPNWKTLFYYAEGAIILLIIGVFAARISETYRYWGRAIIQSGLFYDEVCYRGSYEIIICSTSLPPFETYLAILGILLVVAIFAGSRKR
jgi:hypothetical protein